MPVRTRRQKLLEGICRALTDRLHERVGQIACARGCPRPPADTASIYTLASTGAPRLLDEVLQVHQLARQERGELPGGSAVALPGKEVDRRRMLSAVRAAVYRERRRGR